MPSKLTVLLVEDDDVDQEAFLRAVKCSKLLIDVSIVSDGIAALDQLREWQAEGKCPDMIFLDLKLPRMGGIELMRELSKDVELSTIHIIVLSTSAAERDIEESQRLGAAGYLVKTDGNKYLVKMITRIANLLERQVEDSA